MPKSFTKRCWGLVLGFLPFAYVHSPAFAQVAPVTQPAARVDNVDTGPPTGSTIRESTEITAEDLRGLYYAQGNFANQKYDAALDGFRTFLRKHGNVSHREPEVIGAFGSLADTYIRLRDYREAIEVLNRLAKWSTDATIPDRRAYCYESLDQHAIAADEWRRSVAKAPDDVYPRVWLASLLATSPDDRVRNGEEALALLNGLESQIAETPMIAMTLAAAAAETGNFELAVTMQERFIEVVNNPKMIDSAKAALELYRRHVRPPYIFDVRDPITDDKRDQTLQQSTVVVRVRGRISHELLDRGYCEIESVEREHAGAVVSNHGLVVVSTATIGIVPFVEEGVQPTQKSVWINGPFIEVFAIGKSGDTPTLLGQAEIVGMDEPTGIGIIRPNRPLAIDAMEGLHALEFQPSFAAENQDEKERHFCIGMSAHTDDSPAPDDALVVATLTNAKPLAALKYEVSSLSIVEDMYSWHRPTPAREAPLNVSVFTELSAAPRIGTPVINSSGQCVAMAAPIFSRNGSQRLVGIPASVLSRISGKLISYGHVDRAQLPVLLTPIAKEVQSNGQEKVLGGLQITKVLTPATIFTQLENQVILSVDGVQTPTTSDWLVAMERAFVRGKDVVRCEVAESLGSSVRTVDLPVER